jgi:hypothetical protein
MFKWRSEIVEGSDGMIIAFQIILLFIIGISFIGLVAEKEDVKRQELLFTLIISITISTLLAFAN